MKLETLVLIENRLNEGSTQIYLEHLQIDDPEFFVPVGNYEKPIGYLKFKNIAKKGCFELSELVSVNYPNPNPQFSLSGVLYSRKKAIEAHQAICAYQQAVSLLP